MIGTRSTGGQAPPLSHGSDMSSASKLNSNVLAIFACLLWSTAFVGIKIGLEHTSPLNFAGLRFFLAGLLVLPFAGSPAKTLTIARKNPLFVLKVALFSTALVYALFYLGISMGSASTTAIVVGAGPLFVAIMAHLILPDERLTFRKGASLAVGLSGIVLIASSRYAPSDGSRVEFRAILLLLGCNLSGGYANILVASAKRDIPPLALSALQLIAGGLMLFALSLLVEPIDFGPKPPAYYGALVYLSLLSAAAMTLWFVVLKRDKVKVSEINLWKFTIPVVGAILSWTILQHDHPDRSQLIGMGAIAGALILMYARPRR